jgi:RNA polymerase sigma-70 factor (ECF subfamily)
LRILQVAAGWFEEIMEHPRQSCGELAARLRAGEHDAAAELVDAWYRQIYLFMRRLGHNRQTSEDLTQETFFHAWQHIGQLRDGEMLNSWLYRIAANVSRHHWRLTRNEELLGISVTEEFAVPDGSSTSSEAVGNAELLNLLNRIVAELPMKLKEAVVLHYMQHLTISEAAEAIGVRQGTYKSRLNRALKVIKNQLSEEKKR